MTHIVIEESERKLAINDNDKRFLTYGIQLQIENEGMDCFIDLSEDEVKDLIEKLQYIVFK